MVVGWGWGWWFMLTAGDLSRFSIATNTAYFVYILLKDTSSGNLYSWFYISASVNQCTSGNVVLFNNTYINSPGFPTGVSSATSCNTTGISGRSGSFLSSLFAFFAENLRAVFMPIHRKKSSRVSRLQPGCH